MDLASHRVLVTGGRGFLGAHLVRALARAGAEVHATSREAHEPPPTWWRPDLEDVTSVRELFARARPHVVYHLAGPVSAAPGRDLVLSSYHGLLTSTVNVLLVASESGCRRAVLAGSLTEPTGPKDPPGSPYAVAKQAGTAYARLFSTLYELPVVVARPFMTYGPGQLPPKVVPYVATSLLRGESPELSSGRAESDWIYVDDVIDGLVRAGLAEGVEAGEVDLGRGRLASLRDLVERLAARIGGPGSPRFGVRPERPLERPRRADVDEAARRLSGWRARVGLDEGLSRTVDWLESLEDLPKGE